MNENQLKARRLAAEVRLTDLARVLNVSAPALVQLERRPLDRIRIGTVRRYEAGLDALSEARRADLLVTAASLRQAADELEAALA